MKQGAARAKILLALFLGCGSLLPARAVLTNGLALLPPMGFNSWYQYTFSVNETLIKSIADEMATNGMLAAGYQYINLDDTWMGARDTNGAITANQSRFPGGIKALADYIHAKGFKFGLYTTGSTNTCAGFTGSVGHEEQDAATYASWGVDYVKYELCAMPWYEQQAHGQINNVRMSQAILHCGRPMVFSCSIGTFENWMPNYINLWRGTGDIFPSWSTMLSHIDYVSQTPSFAGPGGWNDADVLEIGNGFLSNTECQSIFSMWCILTGPLLTLNSGTTATNILCNHDAIAVDQDPACLQGICVATNGNVQVWRKPLGASNSTTFAVVLLNRGDVPGTITANWSDIGLPAGVASVWDIWAQAYAGNATNQYTATIPQHGVQFLRIVSGATVPLPPVGTNYLSDLPVLSNYTNAAPVQHDHNATGQAIQLRGTNYAKGLGMTAYSRDDYFLDGTATHFQASLGLDDAAGTNASVIFRVYTDGALIYDSGAVTTATPVRTIDLNVTGAMRLTLEVTNAPNHFANGYGDWALARIVVPAEPTALGGVAVGNAINLSWDAPPGATGYLLLRSTNSGGPYSLVDFPATTSYVDTNVLPDVIYYYVVSAMTANGPTSNSVPFSLELTPYWTNVVTTTAQSWNAAGNWSNTATFPNAISRAAIISANIATNQVINLNQSVTVGSLSIGSSGGAGAFTLASNGGALHFDNGSAPINLSQSSSSAGDTVAAPMVFNGSTVIRNDSAKPLTLSGAVFLGGSLTKTGTGPLVLGGNNVFQGSVTNLQGVLKVTNAGAFTGSPGVTLASGATLDTTALGTGGLVLLPLQTLTGSGAVAGDLTVSNRAVLFLNGPTTTMTFSNNLIFKAGATCSLQIDEDSLTGGTLNVAGAITYGGTLQLTNVSDTPLAAGDSFTLFNAGSYNGAFTNIIPATPGTNLLWSTTGLNTSGTLLVVPGGSLAIGLPQIIGGKLVLNVSGGIPDSTFVVLTSTNLKTSLNQWTRLATNSFDDSGYYSFTNSINTNVAALYYCVQQQ